MGQDKEETAKTLRQKMLKLASFYIHIIILGPLIQSYFPNDILVGLISAGVDCHTKDPLKNPLIHSRITSAIKWIKENSDYTNCTKGSLYNACREGNVR